MKLDATQKTVNRLFCHLWEMQTRMQGFVLCAELKLPITKTQINDARKWCDKSRKLLVETDIVSLLNDLT